jgi:hypothetical protein
MKTRSCLSWSLLFTFALGCSVSQAAQRHGWTTVAPMSVPRLGHAMAEIRPGPNALGLSAGVGKVMVVGGFDAEPLWVPSAQPLDSCEIYDPSTNTWTQTAPHPVAAGWRWAITLENGMVLVVGGAENIFLTVAASHLYDPSTNKWIATKPLPIGLANPHAVMKPVVLPNGQILIAGGVEQNGANDVLSGSPVPTPSQFAYIFTLNWRNPALSSWDYTRDVSNGRISLMPEGRTTSALVLMKNGTVLNVGGLGPLPEEDTEAATNTASLFDPRTGLWRPAAPMPPVYGLQEDESISVYPTALGSRWAPFALPLDNGEVLVAGGTAGILAEAVLRSSALIYNPRTDGWHITTPMHFRRSPGVWLAKFPFELTLLFAGPGVPPSSLFLVHDLTGEIFETANDQWTFAPTAGGPPTDNSVDSFESQSIQLINGNLQIAGGADYLTDSTPTDQSWIYMP